MRSVFVLGSLLVRQTSMEDAKENTSSGRNQRRGQTNAAWLLGDNVALLQVLKHAVSVRNRHAIDALLNYDAEVRPFCFAGHDRLDSRSIYNDVSDGSNR
jgi:hypothetical protein